MKNTKKRGFTIVELVIVIAVIAILAAVLIPTFSNVISKSKESAAMQEARAIWYDHVAELNTDEIQNLDKYTGVLAYKDFFFSIDNGTFTTAKEDKPTETKGEWNFTYSTDTKKVTGTQVK